MKKNIAIFSIPSLLLLLCLSIFPILKILIEVKKVSSAYMSTGLIAYLFLVIVLSIIILVQFIYLLTSLYKLEKKALFKILWTFLLLIFNIFIFTYFYNKYILNKKNVLLCYIMFLIPMVLFVGVFLFGNNVYEDKLKKIEEEKIRIENERSVYNTKDSKVSFTFRHNYLVKDVGEYDLYVLNEEKNVVFTAFTYDTFYYEQKTMDDFLDKGVKDVSVDKEEFKIYKEKEVLDYEDKIITTVVYEGKTKVSSKCIYKISAISFKAKTDYIIYVVEVTTKSNYNKYSKELQEILETIKLN